MSSGHSDVHSSNGRTEMSSGHSNVHWTSCRGIGHVWIHEYKYRRDKCEVQEAYTPDFKLVLKLISSVIVNRCP